MRALAVALALVTGALADQAQMLDKAAAAKIAAIGDRALKGNQGATARRLLLRAIELDPDQPMARARLGFRRVGNDWKDPASSPPGKDASPAAALKFGRELRAEEERRASAYVRAGLTESYLGLLARVPRHEEIHKALGHEKVGSRYARPELVDAARRFDEQQDRWRRLVAPAGLKEAEAEKLPGVGAKPSYRVEDRWVAGTHPDDLIRRLARTTPAPHALMRELFGDSVRTWDRPGVVFMPVEDYIRCVKAVHPPGEERDRWLRSGILRTADLAVVACNDAEQAADKYTHAVGFYSAYSWSTPSGTGEQRLHAWFCEGTGYFATMALHRTGLTWYRGDESSTKVLPTVPPPDGRDRADLLSWLQEQMVGGTTEPLRNVCGRTLNSLDLLMSLEAWSFLEFLAAYNPEALRELPTALRFEEEGAFADRSDRALRECFGKGFDELEPLWRAFVLEIM